MAFNFKNFSVLVVNDVATTRKITVGILRMLQFREVHEAPDGEQGFFRFKDNKPDIVITDLQMTPVDGFSLAKKIRHDHSGAFDRNTPIVLTAGNPDTLSVSHIRDAGFTELLLVPFSVDDIAKRLAYVLTTPRAFIDIENYAGPCRRRKTDPDYAGPFRRQDDQAMEIEHA